MGSSRGCLGTEGLGGRVAGVRDPGNSFHFVFDLLLFRLHSKKTLKAEKQPWKGS